jgi:hypothetical protein
MVMPPIVNVGALTAPCHGMPREGNVYTEQLAPSRVLASTLTKYTCNLAFKLALAFDPRERGPKAVVCMIDGQACYAISRRWVTTCFALHCVRLQIPTSKSHANTATLIGSNILLDTVTHDTNMLGSQATLQTPCRGSMV